MKNKKLIIFVLMFVVIVVAVGITTVIITNNDTDNINNENNNNTNNITNNNIVVQNNTTKTDEEKEITEEEMKGKQKADNIVKQLNCDLVFSYITTMNNLINVNYSYNDITLTLMFDNSNNLDTIYLRTTNTASTNYSNIATDLALLDELEFTTNEIVEATTIIKCITPNGPQDFVSDVVGNYKITSTKSDYINTVKIELVKN